MDSDLPRWLMQALVFTVVPALAAGILAIVETGLVRILKNHRAPLLCRVIRAGSLPLRIAAALLAVLAVLPEAELSTAAEASARRALQIALVAAFGWALARKAGAIFDSMLSHTAQPGEDWLARSRRRTQLVVFRRLAVSAIVLLTAGLVSPRSRRSGPSASASLPPPA